MAETREEVKTFTVRYICDDCGQGEMQSSGRVFMTNPVQYSHRCNKCLKTKLFTGVKYPRAETERIEVQCDSKKSS